MAPEDLTVGEFSSSDFVIVESDCSKEEALEQFKSSNFHDKPSIYYIFVEEDDRLKGVASVKDLMNSSSLEEALRTDYISFRPEMDLEEAARKVAKYDFQAFPVVENERMVGVLRLDDVLEVLEAEETSDMFKQAGVVDEEQFYRSEKMIHASILREAYARVPWLLFSLIGGLIAGTVIESYGQTLQSVVLLAFFIPLIMNIGGNVGTQSSTILVRGMTLGQIHEKNYFKFVAREGLTGLSIGASIGTLSGIAAYLWQGDPVLGVVIAVSMTLTCFTASMNGYLIPLIVHKLGRDPAAVSDPMVTTIQDITALLIYFTVAMTLLGL
jgi:magnesium transporter